MDAKSLAARTEDSLSQNRSTFNRGTGISFPSVSKGGAKSSNKILERILEIERAKQVNKIRLEKELESLDKRQSGEEKKIPRKKG